MPGRSALGGYFKKKRFRSSLAAFDPISAMLGLGPPTGETAAHGLCKRDFLALARGGMDERRRLRSFATNRLRGRSIEKLLALAGEIEARVKLLHGRAALMSEGVPVAAYRCPLRSSKVSSFANRAAVAEAACHRRACRERDKLSSICARASTPCFSAGNRFAPTLSPRGRRAKEGTLLIRFLDKGDTCSVSIVGSIR
jgi:hypothetical protein